MVKFAAILVLAFSVVACSPQEEDPPIKPDFKRAKAADLPHFVEKVTYPATGGHGLWADLYQPDKDKKLGRCVVVLHGGGWIGGGRENMTPIAEQLAVNGFTVLNAEYTLANKGTRWPIQLTDVQALVRYARTQADKLGFDANKIAALGISAGGHLSSFLGSTDVAEKDVSSHVQAVVSISGIHDLRLKMTSEGEQYHIVEMLLSEDGKPSDTQREQASPVTFYSEKTAPTYFIQGDKDRLVPPDQSETAAAKLRGLKVENQLVVVPGMGHGLLLDGGLQSKAFDAACDWLKKQLNATTPTQ
ncbi:MAG: alpha/beta hydrolase [Armatimonadota bacterium]